MKKLLIIFIIIICTFASACSSYDVDRCLRGDELSKKMNNKLTTLFYNAIKKDSTSIYKWSKDDIVIKYYFGRYGYNKDMYVLIVRGYDSHQIEWHYYMHGWNMRKENWVYFEFRNINEDIEVLYDEKIYPLIQAYDEGLLNITEIEDIYNKYINID